VSVPEALISLSGAPCAPGVFSGLHSEILLKINEKLKFCACLARTRRIILLTGINEFLLAACKIIRKSNQIKILEGRLDSSHMSSKTPSSH